MRLKRKTFTAKGKHQTKNKLKFAVPCSIKDFPAMRWSGCDWGLIFAMNPRTGLSHTYTTWFRKVLA